MRIRKLSYFILVLSYCFSLKAADEKQAEVQSIGEIGCSGGTALVIYNAACSASGYLYPNITLGLKIEDTAYLSMGGTSAPRKSLSTIFTVYPFSGSFYAEMNLGWFSTGPIIIHKKEYPAISGLAAGFHFGNRWTIFEHIILGINYLGFTYPTKALLLGGELGFRF